MRTRTNLALAVLAALVACCCLGPLTSSAAAEPLVTLDSPLAGSSTNNQTPTFSGKTDDTIDQVTLNIYAGPTATAPAVQTLSTSPVLLEETWMIVPVTPLAPGTYTAVAEQTNLLTEHGESTAVTFTIDTTAPEVSLNAAASPSSDATPTLTGNAGTLPGDNTSVTVTVYQGANTTGSVAATGEVSASGGTWSLESPHLSDGTYTAQATQADSAGNQGTSNTTTFMIDTTAPLVSLNAVGSPTDNAGPTLSGNAGTLTGDGSSITLTVYHGNGTGGSVAVTETVPTNAGAWSFEAPHLSDGTYTARATQSDSAGNQGTSNTTTFTIDTTPPNVHLSTPADGAFLATKKPTFSGTAGNASGDAATVTLDIYTGSSASGSPTQTVELTRSGTAWTTGSTGPQLSDGTYTAQAAQSDAAGNTARSTTHTFTIKTNAPTVTLQSPGALINNAKPNFSGSAATAPGDSTSVTLRVYRGTSTAGGPGNLAEPPITVTSSGGSWTSGATAHLADGTYTAQAEQEDSAGNVGVSASATFKVDTTAPQITLTSPASGSSTSEESQAVKGSAGTAPGDLPGVAVRLYTGSAGGQNLLESIIVNAVRGAWSATFGGLSPGVYYVRAEQSDQAGNLGVSSQSTFEVLGSTTTTTTTTSTTTTTTAALPTPSPQPPTAAFVWFPTAPHTGERISLASSSTDASSPITSLAWDLVGNGSFQAGPAVITTSFSTPGKHVVRLRVTDAAGITSIAAETITVTLPPLTLMQPFPVVRIAGAYTASGVRLSLLTVQAPAGATVTLRCHGRGCPVKSESHVTTSPKHHGRGAVTVVFKRFQRYLRAGVVLELQVSKPGQIGKYTRFAIRRGRAPERTDACLARAGAKPIACPAS